MEILTHDSERVSRNWTADLPCGHTIDVGIDKAASIHALLHQKRKQLCFKKQLVLLPLYPIPMEETLSICNEYNIAMCTLNVAQYPRLHKR